MMTAEQLTVLASVKRAIGEEAFGPFSARWERAAAEDITALRKCLRDLAHRRGTIRNPAAWLWGAYRREHDGHQQIQEQRRDA